MADDRERSCRTRCYAAMLRRDDGATAVAMAGVVMRSTGLLDRFGLTSTAGAVGSPFQDPKRCLASAIRGAIRLGEFPCEGGL